MDRYFEDACRLIDSAIQGSTLNDQETLFAARHLYSDFDLNKGSLRCFREYFRALYNANTGATLDFCRNSLYLVFRTRIKKELFDHEEDSQLTKDDYLNYLGTYSQRLPLMGEVLLETYIFHFCPEAKLWRDPILAHPN